jgi:hypothetical protein
MTDFKLPKQEMDAVLAIEKRDSEEAANEEMLRALVLQRLQGAVWHTTNSDRFQRILSSGAILPEPNILDAERWSTGRGSQWYPYVRTLGGVSLFDFREFNQDRYSKDYPLSTWAEFVPFRSIWKEAVWIEIDVERLGRSFLSGSDLLARWKAAEVGNRIMPLIEAACLGPLPCAAFKSAFRAFEGNATLADDLWDRTSHSLGPILDSR